MKVDAAGSFVPEELSFLPDCRAGVPGRYVFVLAESLSTLLFERSKLDGLDPSMVLLVLFQELHRRYNREESVTAGYEREGRTTTLTLVGDPTLQEAARAFQQTPRDVAQNDKATIHFRFSAANGPLPVRKLTGSPISLSFFVSDGRLHGSLQYEATSYAAYAAQSLADRYSQILSSALTKMDRPVSELNILSEADIAKFANWNRTKRMYPQLRADQLFQAQAKEHPSRAAVTFQGRSLTYRQLAARAGHLAAQLRGLGVVPGDLVAVYIERCLDVPTAILGVFEAGGAFLALDPALPAERVEFMLKDGQAKVVLTQRELLGRLPETNAEVLCLDMLDYAGDDVPCAVLAPQPGLDDLAYILYTSGSTGKPKGVEITHGALANLLLETKRQVGLDADDVVLATATLSFDISTFEILGPLIAGARVVIVPRSETTNGEALSRVIDTEGATLMQATPSGWSILLETGWKGRSGLKLMTCAEPLSRRLAHKLLERGEAVWNLYGPTETTVYSHLRKIEYDDETITVGHALANYTTYILDGNGKQLPVGAIGELFIGGKGLARGYRNLPALTAERFVPDLFRFTHPLRDTPGARMYRSGDLARYLADGQIEILGRVDNQIKIRGYRVELEEIERVLSGCEAVNRAVAKVIDYGNSDLRLVAFIVPASNSPIDEEQLRSIAAAALPSYMVPSVFCAIGAVPLTPSGKVDRKALSLPQNAKELDAPRTSSGAPQSELEGLVLAAWRNVLKAPELGLDDDFFDCGGHSLLAARMFAQLSSRLDQKLSVTLLLEARTPRRLAERIICLRHEAPRILVQLHVGRPHPPLYLVHHLLGDAMLYRHVANCFGMDERPVFGIQACQKVLDDQAYRSVEKLASVYVAEILERQSAGPFHIAGYSSGGPIAYEMACQLRDMGHEVGLLGLIDASVDNCPTALPKSEKYRKLAVQKACRVAFKMRYELSQSPSETVRKRVKSVLLNWKIRQMEQSEKGERQSGPLTMEQALFFAERAYRPRPYAGDALLVRYRDEAKRFGPDPLMGWGGMFGAGQLQIVDLPGNHVSGLFPPKVANLAAVLKVKMEEVETASMRRGSLLSRTA